jgi:tripartite-type tricarboxylate transporter receptor subunit TctC
MPIQKIALTSLAIALALGIAADATARAYPSRPITIIVPFSAGGQSDILIRILAERMRAPLGQPSSSTTLVVPPAGSGPAASPAQRPTATPSARAAWARML